jgi:site-specific recombinase XerD
MVRESHRRAAEPPEAPIAAKAGRSRPYVAQTDYGTRRAELQKQVILFGTARATIYRRPDVQRGSWYFRTYLKAERRQYKASLKTTDRREAIKFAENELVDILAKVKSGQRILSLSLKDLKRQYLEHIDRRVVDKQIAATTMALLRYRINHGFQFLIGRYSSGMDTKITGIDGSIFHDYLSWRRERIAREKEKGTIRADVVRDELIAIRKMFHFARENKLCTDKSIPQWSFAIEKEGPRRRRLEPKNYIDVVNSIRSWVGESATEREVYNRHLLQSVFLTIAKTGMRTGEAFGLLNSDLIVMVRKNESSVSIRAETSKVRRSRTVPVFTPFGGPDHTTQEVNPLLVWVKSLQRHKNADDFVFSTFEDGKRSARDVYYHTYKGLRLRLAEIGLGWFDTYHCRHFWATSRLHANESIHTVAKVLGSSTREVERTYSHVTTEQAGNKMNERFVIYDSDGSFTVIEKGK